MPYCKTKNLATKRNVNGVLLLDKPSGLSSNCALQRAKHLFRAKKAGHTGSLDPLATGMLPICFGEATKFSQYLLDSDKSYITRVKLGLRTTTGDSEGEVLATKPVENISLEKIEEKLRLFKGKITQIPSMYSAIKHGGQPLYKLARQGIEVERKSRQISIYESRVLAFKNDEVELFVSCSKGTYIRTLVEDLGAALDCGAHVIALRRTQVSHYQASQMISMQQLEQASHTGYWSGLDDFLLPIQGMFPNFPVVQLEKITALYLKQGNIVTVPQPPRQGLVCVMDKEDTFVGLGKVQSDGRLALKRLVSIIKQVDQ